MTKPLNSFTHDGVDLHYVDSHAPHLGANDAAADDDQPCTLFFVHGMFCNWHDWRFQMEHLATRFRCVAMDLRGHGKSALDTTNDNDIVPHADIARMGHDVSALAQSLDLTNVVLIGHSMGCRVIFEANRHMNERVAGLVLVDGSRFSDNIDEANEVTATLVDIDFDSFAARLFAQMFTSQSNEAFKAETIARLADIPHAFGKALFASLLNWDASRMDTVFGQAKQPLLVAQSTRIDKNRRRHPLQKNDAVAWLDYLTGFTTEERIHRFVDVGHFPQVDEYQTFNDLLIDFVGQLTDSST